MEVGVRACFPESLKPESNLMRTWAIIGEEVTDWATVWLDVSVEAHGSVDEVLYIDGRGT